jgi:hypothetical protein
MVRKLDLLLAHKSADVQNFGSSGSSAIVLIQHAAQSLPPPDLTDAAVREELCDVTRKILARAIAPETSE